jgi:serine protease Do
MNYDIAILKVENSDIIKNSPVVTATLGDSEKVRVFDEVYAVGNPEAFGMAVTEGIISVESESLSMTGADGRTAVKFRVMRISAAINSGNSGGGLYDTEGRLIGIVNAKRQGSDIDNIAYAIPVNLAVALADNIIYHCDGLLKTSVYRCKLGVSIKADSTGVAIDPNTGAATIVEVVKVEKLEENSTVTDLILAGDIITAITVDGVRHTVTRTHHVIDNMLTVRVGSTVTLTVTRGSSSLDVTVTVPESAQSAVR